MDYADISPNLAPTSHDLVRPCCVNFACNQFGRPLDSANRFYDKFYYGIAEILQNLLGKRSHQNNLTISKRLARKNNFVCGLLTTTALATIFWNH